MTTLQKSSQDQLRQYIEKAERVEEDIAALKADLKDIFLEAKAEGFDVKTMKKIITLRKKSKTDRDEEEALLDTYKAALGMLAGTPLGEWAKEKAEAA